MSRDQHWLLTLRAGSGRVWRLTSAPQPVTITGDDGRPIPFDPGLDAPTPSEGADDPDGAEVPIAATLPRDAWIAIADARDMADWTAELALWTEGEAWAQRRIWMDGRVDRPVYANEGAPVAFSVVEAPWEDRGQIPPAGQVVTAEAWPVTAGTACPDAAMGQYYPWVFGAPGLLYSGDAFAEFAGWPAILVQIDETTRDNFSGAVTTATLIVAGHAMAADNIRVINRSTGLSAQISLDTFTDGAGNTVTVVQVTDADLQITEGDELWLACVSADEGGYPSAAGAVARGAGQIADLLLRLSTVRYDLTQLPQLRRLDAFRLDFVVNAPISPWSAITDRLIDGGRLPAFWRRSARGYWIAVQPFEDALLSTAPTLSLDPDLQGGEMDGSITVSSSAEVVTDIALRYAYGDSAGNALRLLGYAPMRSEGATLSAWLAAALARVKVRRALEIEAPAIQDPATAALILGLYARRLSATRRSGAWFVPQDDAYQPGQVVAVTDAEIRWTDRRCWILSVSPASEGGWMRVEVEELPDLLRTRGPGL